MASLYQAGQLLVTRGLRGLTRLADRRHEGVLLPQLLGIIPEVDEEVLYVRVYCVDGAFFSIFLAWAQSGCVEVCKILHTVLYRAYLCQHPLPTCLAPSAPTHHRYPPPKEIMEHHVFCSRVNAGLAASWRSVQRHRRS